MSLRPYSQLEIGKLESLFKSSKWALDMLTTINRELKHRRNKRAKSLRTKIVDQEQKINFPPDPDEVFLTLEEIKKRHVIRVLKSTKGNKANAAKILGIDRKTIYRIVDGIGNTRRMRV
jgi:transcriptional regulator of acetoin/glycerol metabolism